MSSPTSSLGFGVVHIPVDEPVLAAEAEASLRFRSPRRREQFVAGRVAARRALKDLGVTFDRPLLSDDQGMPKWPPGVVGSLSHTDRFAACIVGLSERYWSLGLDIEDRAREVRADILRRVGDERELKVLRALLRYAHQDIVRDDAALPLLLFSFKESVYKALFPFVQKKFWFEAVRADRIEDRTVVFRCADWIGEALPNSTSVKGILLPSQKLFVTVVSLKKEAQA